MGDWINKVKTRGKVIAFDESFWRQQLSYFEASDGRSEERKRTGVHKPLLNSRVSPLFAKRTLRS
jgi:hypothetical protein